MSQNWSRKEAEAIVQDYLDMLCAELRRQRYNKAERRRRLRKGLNGRSDGSVERKHQNISAVLVALGLPFVSGYKPLGNYQQLLAQVVEEQLTSEVVGLIEADVTAGEEYRRHDLENALVSPPEPAPMAIGSPQNESATTSPGRVDYLKMEADNASLGDAGEMFVIEYERDRLRSAGKDHLARNVEQVSLTVGHHAGYDVRSYEIDGRDRLIEAKTTRYEKHTPFFISAAEVRFSQNHQSKYYLYRVFDFRENPRLFALPGDISAYVQLNAYSYRAHF